MEYEQKYKEALKVMESLYNVVKYQSSSDALLTSQTIEKAFPELKESDDEKIRKEIIQSIKDNMCVIHKEKCLAWLEKQDEQNTANFNEAEREKNNFVCRQFIECRKSFNEFKEFASYWFEYVGDDTYIGRSDNILNQRFHITPQQLFTLFTHHCPKKENQYEKKPADKVKQNFKCGEWIVCFNEDEGETSIPEKVAYFSDNKVRLIDTNGVSMICPKNVLAQYRLWTIQDAKDGDILFHSDSASNGIFIFRESLKYAVNEKVMCYCDYDSEDHFCLGENHTCCWADAKILQPATKEQRDLLFQKMKEAGYEWDAEKKELKKIEQKPDGKANVLMSLDEAIEHCREKSCGNNDCALEHKQLEKWLTELKELKEQKPAWSEEDKKMLDSAIYLSENSRCEIDKEETVNWLNSIKDRAQSQPKQEWSEDDSWMLNVCCNAIDSYKEPVDKYLVKNWLKSIKPNHWKPSEFQLKCLKKVIPHDNTERGCELEDVLTELYDNLKKL